MAGRFLNPHIHRPIWIPAFDANNYREAVQWPSGAVHGDHLRVLLLTASPADMTPISVSKEEKEIKNRITAGMARGGKVELRIVRNVMPSDIIDVLNEFRPHVLHFAVHGDPDGNLYGVNASGDHALLSREGLAAAFSCASDDLKMVVMNACYSAVIAEEICREVDCAVGIRTAVADASSLAYIEKFYGAFSHGLSLADAHAQGLAELKLHQLPNSKDIHLYVRPGCDAAEWIPLPGVRQPGIYSSQ